AAAAAASWKAGMTKGCISIGVTVHNLMGEERSNFGTVCRDHRMVRIGSWHAGPPASTVLRKSPNARWGLSPIVNGNHPNAMIPIPKAVEPVRSANLEAF